LLITKVVNLNMVFNSYNFNYILMVNCNHLIDHNLISHIPILNPYSCFINFHTYLVHLGLIHKDYNLAYLNLFLMGYKVVIILAFLVLMGYKVAIIQAFLILAYLILAFLILAFLILAFLILAFLIQAFLIQAFLILAFLILAFLIQAFLILAYLILAYLILAYLILAYLNYFLMDLLVVQNYYSF